MRPRWSILLFIVAMVLAACTSSSAPGAKNVAATRPGDLLFLDTGVGVRALDSATGHVLFEAAGAVATPDWSALFTSSPDGRATDLRTLDPLTGATRSSVRIPGDLVASVVAANGQSVALVEPGAEGAFPGLAAGRAFTRLAVVDPADPNETYRFRLRGNFEPEAFSTDDQRLFMIQYLPATAPKLYRVTWLDLRTGKVWPAGGPSKGPVEKMTGTRITRVLAPDYSTLYTLYTNQSPVYTRAAGIRPVAFVHTLNLEYGQAICVGLPRAFGPGPANAKTLAVSPDGSRLYVVDAARGLVSVVYTRLQVTHTGHVDFGPIGSGVAVARVGPDGTLYVGEGSQVVALDGSTLAVQQRWPVGGTVTGLGLGTDGGRLYVALADRVEELDLPTGDLMGAIPSPGVQGIRYVAPLAA